MNVTRRDLLKGSGLSLLGLSLNLSFLNHKSLAKEELKYPYRNWEDIYKKQWSWDRVVKGTHSVANCSGTCGFDLYVKEGIVWREEQLADYPQTIHASLWVNPKLGTDIALALGMTQMIVEENLYNTPYIKEQTALPFLVRKDNRKFLMEKDLEEGGKEDVFYVWDVKSQSPKKAPGSMGHTTKSIALGDLDPALEGSWFTMMWEVFISMRSFRPLFKGGR